MGMYTKYSIDISIGHSSYAEGTAKEDAMVYDLSEKFKGTERYGKFIGTNLKVIEGHNGCVHLYACGEVKNYEHDIERLFDFLCDNIPEAEGFLHIQYEEDEFPTVAARRGNKTETHIFQQVSFNGYGNAWN